MPKWKVRVRRVCTDYDYADIEIEADTAEAARAIVADGASDNFITDDVEFGNSEVIDTEYEVDERFAIERVS